MPTKAELGNLSNNLEAVRINFQESCHSWTDDLPVCQLSGVGSSTNQKYRVDGIRREEHAFEDKSFHFRCYENTYFYGVFDGHAGPRAADFAAQRMPAEILLGQLMGKETDKEVRELLHQAFLTVEKGFFESIDDLLAEKENLRLQLQGLKTMEAIERFPEVVQRLKCVTEEIQSGTTAVIALILDNRLYVANVGNSRAVLCKEDNDGKICIIPLTVDHTFANEDELLRLSHLGLDVSKLRQDMKNNQRNCTRCIGNYTSKGGYKEFDNFSEATEEPIIAEPNIVGGITIDDKCKFLILMSEGLYRSMEEATKTTNPNTVLVNMLLEQFSKQSTLNGVAQAVVDKVVRIHSDTYTREGESQKRDDITLLVRNFNCLLPNAHSSLVSSYNPEDATANPEVNKENISENNTLLDAPSLPSAYPSFMNDSDSMFDNDESFPSSTDSGPHLFQSATDLSLDEDGKIKPYVDFSDVFAAIEEATRDGLIIEE